MDLCPDCRSYVDTLSTGRPAWTGNSLDRVVIRGTPRDGVIETDGQDDIICGIGGNDTIAFTLAVGDEEVDRKQSCYRWWMETERSKFHALLYLVAGCVNLVVAWRAERVIAPFIAVVGMLLILTGLRFLFRR